MLRKYVYCSNILSMLAVWIFKTSRVSFTKLGVKIRTMSTGISINNSMVVYPIRIIKNSVSGHFSSSDMKILKDQSAQTTARVVSVAYCLWLPFLINRVLNLTILHPRNGVILYILPLCTYLSSNFIFVVPTLWKQQRLLTFRGI